MLIMQQLLLKAKILTFIGDLMNKYFNKKTLICFTALLFIFSIFGFNSTSKAKAEPNNIIVIPKGEDHKKGIFNDKDGEWYPGREVAKEFNVKNLKDRDVNLVKITLNVESLYDQKTAMNLSEKDEAYREFMNNMSLTLENKGKKLYDGNFEKLVKEGVTLSEPLEVKSKDYREFKMKVKLDDKSSNALQKMENKFNFNVTYTFDDGTSVNIDLPKTGSIFSSKLLCISGMLMILSGIVMLFAKREYLFLKKEGI